MTLGRLAALLVVATTLLSSCKDDGAQGDGLELRYPGVTNIGPGMSFAMPAPSYIGGARPEQFAIFKCDHDGESFDPAGIFSIDAATGVVSVGNTASLQPGEYVLGVSCTASGRAYSYPEAVRFSFSPSTPAEAVYSPSVIEVMFGATAEATYTPDTAKIVQIAPSVGITKFELAAFDGSEYFTINASTGAILLARNVNIPIGTYSIALKITTPAGVKQYDDVVRYSVNSAPLTLTYTPNPGKVEFDQAYQSTAPVCEGSAAGLVYSVAGVTPDDGGKIAINAQTGVLSVTAGNQLDKTTYVVDVKAVNGFGEKTFAAAYSLQVVDFINPISGFGYPAAVNAMQGVAFSAAKNGGFVGDEVTYTFVNLPAALQGKVSLDTNTGAVSAVKGNTIAINTYTVAVRATNVKGTADASFSLVVAANPNMFTYVRWGNNLGLTPEANYADQFSYPQTQTWPVSTSAPATDATVPLEYSIINGLSANAINTRHFDTGYIEIDPDTGVITTKQRYTDGNSSGNSGTGVLIVKAVAGEGTPAEVVVVTPVFFRHQATGAVVTFNPFAVKINPRTGGTGPLVTLSGVADQSKFLMDYRRDAIYLDLYNGGLGTTGASGTPATANTFLNYLWMTKYQATGTGVKHPFSYYRNLTNLSKALLYMDNSTAGQVRLKVNPDKFVDEQGNYAKGVLKTQIQYRIDGQTDDTSVDNGANFNGLIVWFDESF
jgi:hypothetical protein